ncbi:MAG: hypothetical protein HY347_00155 [candidate division NC10 bacterium]|nr:hypothetical protein [candidate division NC10 bacterium]
MAVQKDPHERAKRLARLIVSDLILYNQQKILEGITNDSLFDLLKDEIQKGREYYEKNVDPGVLQQTNYFNETLVDMLLKGKGHIPSKIW